MNKIKKYSILTNITILIAAGVHLYHGSFVTPFIFGLSLMSGFYHYYLAREDAGVLKSKERLKVFRNLDVAFIYLVLGAYPIQLIESHGEPFIIASALILLQAVIMFAAGYFAINKIRNEDPFDANKVIPALAVIVLTIGFFTRPLWMAGSVTAFIVMAYFYQMMANKFRLSGNVKGYDKAHGEWHNYSGVSFMIIH